MPLYPGPARTAGVAPADSGYVAWNFDPAGAAATGSSPMVTAGTPNVQRLYLERAATITYGYVHVQTAGATLTANSCKAALYNAAGTLLTTTGDQSTSWNSTGTKQMAWGTVQQLLPGYYDFMVWYNGTTGPSFIRGTSYSFVTGFQTGASIRSATTSNTGTTTTAPATMGTKTASVQNFWVALA